MEELWKIFSNEQDHDPVLEIAKYLAHKDPGSGEDILLEQALEEIAARLMPKTDEGIMFLLMLIRADLHQLTPPSSPEWLKFHRIVRTLTNIIKSIEQSTGSSRDDFGASHFRLQCDPRFLDDEDQEEKWARG